MTDPLFARVTDALGSLYDIESEIGRGGMAIVYRARDRRLRRPVAIKVLPPDMAFRGYTRRFLHEAETAAQLDHPSIVPIYTVDERDGLVYFVMALVDGESLASRLAREPRPPTEFVRRVLRDVSDALAYAHARGVVHRDIKPDNILLGANGGSTERAMVSDFSIARAREGDDRLTATGVVVGSPAYMSPEQALGEGEVDGRSDLYSLGVVGYQMLAGALPFRAASVAAVLMKHISERPRPLAELRADVPPALAEVIERAMAKAPAQRWPDAAAMRAALDAAGVGAPAAAPAADAPPSTASRADAIAELERALDPLRGDSRDEPGDAIRRDIEAAAAASASPAGARPAWPRADARRNGRDAPPPSQPAYGNGARDLWDDRGALPDEYGEFESPGGYAVEQRDAPLRREVRERWGREGMALFADRPLPERVRIFRRKLVGSAFGIGALAFINLATFPFFPWFIFPAMGIGARSLRRWRNLRQAGLSFEDALLGEVPPELLAQEEARRAAAAVASARAARLQAQQVAAYAGSSPSAPYGRDRGVPRAPQEHVAAPRPGALAVPRAPAAPPAFAPPPPARPLVEQAEVFRRRAKLTAAAGLTAGVSLVIGAGFNIDPLIVPFLAGTAGSILGMGIVGRMALSLRRQGVRVRKLFGGQWREAVAEADRRPREVVLGEQAAELAGAEVLAGPHGDMVRRAVSDRAEVREALAKLPPEDKALLPQEIVPTVDALVGRVAALAASLHRLDADVPPDTLARLDERIATAERDAAAGSDQERKLTLLRRQRTTVDDLLTRRAALFSQLDSAALVLRNIRLDLLKLRSAGVQSSLDDVTIATQEARALSREIGNALDAVVEAKRL